MLITIRVANFQAQCSIQTFRLSLNWRSYIDREAFLLYLGFVLLQVILAVIPLGVQVDGPLMKGGRHKTRTNGNSKCILVHRTFSLFVIVFGV